MATETLLASLVNCCTLKALIALPMCCDVGPSHWGMVGRMSGIFGEYSQGWNEERALPLPLFLPIWIWRSQMAKQIQDTKQQKWHSMNVHHGGYWLSIRTSQILDSGTRGEGTTNSYLTYLRIHETKYNSDKYNLDKAIIDQLTGHTSYKISQAYLEDRHHGAKGSLTCIPL